MVINVDNNKLHYLTPHTQTYSEVGHVKLLGQRELLGRKAALHYQIPTFILWEIGPGKYREDHIKLEAGSGKC